MSSTDEGETGAPGLPITDADPAFAETGAKAKLGDLETQHSGSSSETRVARPGTEERSGPAPSVTPAEGLEPIVLLGSGGMGEVHRAHDRRLNRLLAMKVLHERLGEQGLMRARFNEEAQVTAQLAHPSIPPVHEVGELKDGRLYFTMKEVHGQTLQEVIEDVDEDGRCALSERRRLEVFQKICDAVAYAHARGVVHCDLKPPNVMVGAFGEVLVMDWGVARIVKPAASSKIVELPVHVPGSTGEHLVAGTPAYMPPEQAIGGEDLDTSADVFSLGVMLYELLALERPYRGNPRELVFLAARGEIPDLPRTPGSVIDDALMEIIKRAMSPMPTDRYPDAGPMAEDLARWREGARRREDALDMVKDAEQFIPLIEPQRVRARELRDEAEQALVEVGPAAPPAQKAQAWALEDEATQLENGAALAALDVIRLLRAALRTAPDLTEADALLAEIHHAAHRDAERARDWREAAHHEVHLRSHSHGEYDEYLGGEAEVHVVIERPCAVRLRRYELEDRCLVPGEARELGTLDEVRERLPIGSYVLELTPASGATVCYPFDLRRGEGWDGIPPNKLEPSPLALPETHGEGEIGVPAGWFVLGGDPAAMGAGPRQRVWLDGFVMRRDPVTFRELARFLADPAGAPFREGALRDGSQVWRSDSPAVGLPWLGARSYAAWYAEQTGAAWRLPSELEWEKAARGVDGRCFPWGDFGNGSFCHARDRGRAPETLAPIDAHPHDVSPYGLRGAAGNTREWCATPFKHVIPAASRRTAQVPEALLRVVRGGSWRLPLAAARVCSRAGLDPARGYDDVGFRLVRSLG